MLLKRKPCDSEDCKVLAIRGYSRLLMSGDGTNVISQCQHFQNSSKAFSMKYIVNWAPLELLITLLLWFKVIENAKRCIVLDKKV